MKGDCCIGRGCRQRRLARSRFANPYKVAQVGREQTIDRFKKYLSSDLQMRSSLWILSGLRLVCHCGERQACHADSLIAAYTEMFPAACDSSDLEGAAPSSLQLNYLARLREKVESDEGSSTDEGAAARGDCWSGLGRPLQVGVVYTVRDCCDGQSLASLGRWPVAARRYPETEAWRDVVGLFRKFTQQYGTKELLMNLALGRVEENAFPSSGGATQVQDC